MSPPGRVASQGGKLACKPQRFARDAGLRQEASSPFCATLGAHAQARRVHLDPMRMAANRHFSADVECRRRVDCGWPIRPTGRPRPDVAHQHVTHHESTTVRSMQTRRPGSRRHSGARPAVGPHQGDLRDRSSTGSKATSRSVRSVALELQGAFRAWVSRCQGRVRTGQAWRWWRWPDSPPRGCHPPCGNGGLRPAGRATPAAGEPPAPSDVAASDRQRFLRARLGARPTRPGSQPCLDEIAKPLIGLLLLVAPHHFADVLAGVAVVAVVAGRDSVVDALAHRLRVDQRCRLGPGRPFRRFSAALRPAAVPAPGRPCGRFRSPPCRRLPRHCAWRCCPVPGFRSAPVAPPPRAAPAGAAASAGPGP